MNIATLYTLYQQNPSVETDTRKLKPGDIFFALKGPNFNGNKFAAQALQAGAAYAIIDEAEYAINDKCMLVDDVLATLQQLALHHRKQFDIPFIAITGSNGKTTTKELITAVLKKKYITYATEGNLNNHIGVPLTLLKIKSDAEIAVIEMGANHLKEIEFYCKIAMPSHALITNTGKAHIEGFGSIEGVRKGKGELYDFIREYNGVIFRNTDLPYLETMAHGIKNQVTYGTQNANYIGKPVMKDVFVGVELPAHNKTIHSNLVGDYNFPNLMVAITIGLYFQIPLSDIEAAIEAYNPDNSRSQWVQRSSNKLILDAYNANPGSMNAAITNFANTALENKRIWIGAMKEMGTEERREHEDLIRLIQQYVWQQVILVGKEFSGIANDYMHFNTSAEAADYVRNNPPANAAILIKGSRGSRMELMADALPL